MLLTIAYQIAENDLVYQKYITDVLLKIEKCGTVRSLWKILFANFFDLDECRLSVYMVIDGIDELDGEDQVEFLQTITAIDRKRGKDAVSRISILLVGRPEISVHVRGVPNIMIGPDKNGNDIKRFIRKTITKCKKISRDKKLRKEIEKQLISGAKGYFFWAQLMLDELKKKEDLQLNEQGLRESVRRSLKDLPKDLVTALKQILEGYAKYQPEEVEVLNVGFNSLIEIATTNIYCLVPPYMGCLCSAANVSPTIGRMFAIWVDRTN